MKQSFNLQFTPVNGAKALDRYLGYLNPLAEANGNGCISNYSFSD